MPHRRPLVPMALAGALVRPLRRQRIVLLIVGSYLWVMMILLGSIMLETFMVYPNIFYNPPDSFKAGLEFMKVRTPHDFYPPLGFFSWLLGAASLIAAWPIGRARRWILASLAMIVAEGLFSRAFFWPRNAIMFVEGPAVHSAAVLRQAAEEFQRMHWWRVAFNVAGSAAVFKAFLAYYRGVVVLEEKRIR
jgi:hypothetical protein